ncbi:MAG: RHS repeat-associated protein [Chlamydiales bacterium]
MNDRNDCPPTPIRPAMPRMNHSRAALRLSAAVLTALLGSPFAMASDAELSASDASAGDSFGSVAATGSWLAVGARLDDAMGTDSGSVYLFQGTGANWSEVQKLVASDGGSGDAFGSQIAMSGNLLVVSAPQDNADAGSAYVFRNEGGFWSQAQKLVAMDGAAGDRFGTSIDVRGNEIVVGAYNHQSLGAAYVFRDEGGTFSQVTKLQSDVSLFGYSVAIAGDTIAVGGIEGVALYRAEGAFWSLENLLVNPDGPGSIFGIAVALSAGQLAVGAWLDDQMASNAGAVHMYDGSGGSWAHVAKLTAFDASINEYFGGQLVIDDGRLLVGVPASSSAGVNTGAAYMFLQSAGNWAFEEKLLCPTVTSGDGLGGSVTLNETAAFAGAYGRNTSSGSVFVEELPTYIPLGFEPGGEAQAFAAPEACTTCKECAVPNVYPFAGEFQLQEADLTIPGRGANFAMGRKYRSQLGIRTPMGAGWDFSYNVFLESVAGGLLLHDGNSRQDFYPLQPSGTFTRAEFQREIEQEVDGSYTVRFADGGSWRLNALDHPSAPGRLTEITERNDNRLDLVYNATGQMVTVRDTLHTAAHPREVQFAYNADGFLASVGDWTGRVVSYAYYQDGDAGGSFGDLKSVTTPAVVATGDYPLPADSAHFFGSGKTTVYTYSQGFVNEDLNHNLLTITDPNGQTFLHNTYAATLDPNDFLFDHLISEALGEIDDLLNFTYTPVVPGSDNGYAVIRFMVNDRVGNAEELFYDASNRLVLSREYTGRWDADMWAGPPSAPSMPRLRASDPDYFETRWEYNEDALVTRMVEPNGTEEVSVYELELNPGASWRTRGNLRELHRYPGTHLPVGDQTVISQYFEFAPDTGCGCGVNFVTRYTDPRGNVTLSDYDSPGNLLQRTGPIAGVVDSYEYNAFGQMTRHVQPANASGYRREDTYVYHDAGAGYQEGYLAQEVLDATNEALVTGYEYNRVGNVVRVTDPNGNVTDTLVNQLGRVVRTTLPASTPGATRYMRDNFFDGNDNVIRREFLNVDAAGQVGLNAWLTTTIEHEILNRVVRVAREIDTLESATVEYAYDANRNRTLRRSAEAVNGNQPDNVTRSTFDERDLLFLAVQAPGAAAQASTQFDYDGNSNPMRVAQGLESSPRVTVRIFDAYDRPLSQIDPMGNVTEWHYDPSGSPGGQSSPGVPTPFAVRRLGQSIDTPGATGNQPLYEVQYTYDALDRRTSEQRSYFDLNTQVPIATGSSMSTVSYSPDSAQTSATDDNGHATTWTYDSVGRVLAVLDAAGNETHMQYDPNSNLISLMEIERSTSGAPDQVFTTLMEHDGLDRTISRVDSTGNLTVWGHDSRSNRTVSVDALGNTLALEYDGLNRRTESRRVLTDNGKGSGSPTGLIVTAYQWDHNSRVVAAVDPQGNTTEYHYDALDRMVMEEFADATSRSHTHDVHSNRLTSTDANGTTVASSFDLLDRVEQRTVSRAAGVLGTTSELYRYNGLGQIVLASDDDSEIVRGYDSLGHLRSETLTVGSGIDETSGSTTFTRDGLGNVLQLTYPGGRQIGLEHDALDRLQTVREDPQGQSSFLAGFDHVGPTRLERIVRANGVETLFEYDGMLNAPSTSADHGVKRPIAVTHRNSSTGQRLDRRSYRWSSVGTKRMTTVADGNTSRRTRYTYDSAYRLTASREERRVTSAATAGLGLPADIHYALDPAGSRTQVHSSRPVNMPGLGQYESDPVADAPLNQYSDAPTGERAHDANGNVGRVGTSQAPDLVLSYDYRNQMVAATDAGGQLHTYTYDCFGRRISRTVDQGGSGEMQTRYFHAAVHVIEEQSAFGATLATYVHTDGIDNPLSMKRGSSETYFLADDLGSIVATTNAAGNVTERYRYGDFGAVTVLNPIGNPRSSSAIDNPLLFTGRRFDPETGLYYLRHRYLDPAIGRFTVRDPLGIWGDTANLGNGYTYAGNRPTSLTDPFGLEGEDDAAAPAGESGTDWVKQVKKVVEALNDLKNGTPSTAAKRLKGYFKCFSKKIGRGSADPIGIFLQMSESLDAIADVSKDLGELKEMGHAKEAAKILEDIDLDQPEEEVDYARGSTNGVMRFCWGIVNFLNFDREDRNRRIRIRNAVRKLRLQEMEEEGSGVTTEEAAAILNGDTKPFTDE